MNEGLGRLRFVIVLAVSLTMPGPRHTCVAGPQQANAATAPVEKPPLTLEEVISRLQEKNHARELALRSFQGTRVYSVDYQGFFGEHHAQAVVRFSYVAPDNRTFTIVSETGSKFIIEHVIKGLLKGEEEAAKGENRQRNALTAQNYSFALAEGPRDGSQYVLSLTPNTHYKYLYRGKIWVDARDFAVTRIEAEPAKSPSFWVKRTEVQHAYEKVGDFWLPAEDKTESFIRLGGVAHLSIEYSDYKITEAAPLAP